MANETRTLTEREWDRVMQILAKEEENIRWTAGGPPAKHLHNTFIRNSLASAEELADIRRKLKEQR